MVNKIITELGKIPTGSRQERIEKSPNFRNGQFRNLEKTPQLTEGYTMLGVIQKMLFGRNPQSVPSVAIPTVKTDLKNLSLEENVLVWFGHSSYFLQIDGKRILVDPVLSGNASPIQGTNKSFAGTEIYTVEEIPNIDYLFISHDHYDHLDYETVLKLKSKIGKIICALGVGSHFEYWGYDASQIIEKDWHEQVDLDNGFAVFVTPARHFSGRSLKRSATLWCSFVLQTPTQKIFLGGDSGYGKHFAEIGKIHANIDLAILENGQYNVAWQYIHSFPEQVLQAAKDLNAKRVFPVHSAKFALANHNWDEPLSEIAKHNATYKIPLMTPMIGEAVQLNYTEQQFKEWWATI